MKKSVICFCFIMLFLLSGCHSPSSQTKNAVDATQHGVSSENDGAQNSAALQALIDRMSDEGGTIYIPSGEYRFAANGTQTIGSHCIKMRSDVSIVGDGESTVLKPTGNSLYGLDMFYFNDYLDTGAPVYLKNCRFESFVIDASGTSCAYYTSAGKGFMFNLFENCHWENITVKNTDATGFGVDCPINSTISRCAAISCGKAAAEESTGASGFGIGFGYSENESILITDCHAVGNKKFGFFFEHQGRFNSEKYAAVPNTLFTVQNCAAMGNLFGFGGVCSENTVYENCRSENSIRYGFVFENSKNSKITRCTDENAGEAAFAVLQTDDNGEIQVSGISVTDCRGKHAPLGIKISVEKPSVRMHAITVRNCLFEHTDQAVYTYGKIQTLTLSGNISDSDENTFLAEIETFSNFGNSWNETIPVTIPKENNIEKVIKK